jgi:hypothetical protein
MGADIVRLTLAAAVVAACVLPISVHAENKTGGAKPPAVKPATAKSAADPKPFIKLEGVAGESKDAKHKDQIHIEN